MTGKQICEVLNELHDENLALKSSNREYEEKFTKLDKKIKELNANYNSKKTCKTTNS